LIIKGFFIECSKKCSRGNLLTSVFEFFYRLLTSVQCYYHSLYTSVKSKVFCATLFGMFALAACRMTDKFGSPNQQSDVKRIVGA
jgi:hypothetical protein